MKSSARGFTLIELLVSLSIMAVASVGAGAAIFQVFRNTERNSDHMNAVSQAENAGYWISRDAQMALSVNATASLTPPDFLALSWITWDANGGNPIYHSAKYFFEGLTNGVGALKRNHTSTAGANEYTLIAQYIYYDTSDVDNTSNASYQSPVLTVRITSLVGQSMENKEYKIKRRSNY